MRAVPSETCWGEAGSHRFAVPLSLPGQAAGAQEGAVGFLTERWQDLFHVGYEVLLYDLTSTYFECDPPGEGKRRYGYSRDQRPDCVQVVIALVITPEGLPIAYEVLAGNTSDKTTLKNFLEKIEQQYGKIQRTWVMERGIPTEEVLKEIRQSSPAVCYLVGIPRGRLTRLEKDFLQQPSRDQLLQKLGAAKADAGMSSRLVEIHAPSPQEEVNVQTFTFSPRKEKLRAAMWHEGSTCCAPIFPDKIPPYSGSNTFV